ncbi:MAG: hypothetical protein L6Q52_12940 [Rhodocyclaceae bacterium]|nr:hypothetical protein [Rhodocyclaceae bacterium]
MLIPTSNESQLRAMCANKEGESIPSFKPTPLRYANHMAGTATRPVAAQRLVTAHNAGHCQVTTHLVQQFPCRCLKSAILVMAAIFLPMLALVRHMEASSRFDSIG